MSWISILDAERRCWEMVRILHIPSRFNAQFISWYKDFKKKCHLSNREPRRGSPGTSWSGTMGNHYRSILTAWALATVPMLALAVAFVVSVELFRVDLPAGSYYLETDSSHDMPLGSAIYSEIPSTQLTYIASFSSTLATTVLPAVMSLFSYTVALAITRDSDTENHRRLPSPYQLELLISTLNSSLLTLWSFVWYLFSPRRRREAIVPSLSKASSLFSAIAILAWGPSNSLISIDFADQRKASHRND